MHIWFIRHNYLFKAIMHVEKRWRIARHLFSTCISPRELGPRLETNVDSIVMNLVTSLSRCCEIIMMTLSLLEMFGMKVWKLFFLVNVENNLTNQS